MVVDPEHRLLRLLLAFNAAALLLTSAFVGGWADRLSSQTLPPYTAAVQIAGRRGEPESSLSFEDRAYIQGLPGVEGLEQRASRRARARNTSAPGDSSRLVSVFEASAEWPRLAGFRLVAGRSWTGPEATLDAPIALVSGAWPAIPQSVEFDGRVRRVIGVLEQVGTSTSSAPSIWIPPSPTGRSQSAFTYIVRVDGSEQRDLQIAAAIDRWLQLRHPPERNGQSAFAVLTFEEARAQAAVVRRALFIAVLVFCGIPSVLAGSGVAASTRLAIEQRVPEIGLRRAVGATKQQILDLFVGEALHIARSASIGALTLVAIGLVIGQLLGWPIAPPLSMMIISAILPSAICFAFSVPQAIVAAELPPISALAGRG